jgi:hypothetical protein
MNATTVSYLRGDIVPDIVVLLWAAMIYAGYVAGRNRGRAAAGVLWTLLLGPVGLAIVLSFTRPQS